MFLLINTSIKHHMLIMIYKKFKIAYNTIYDYGLMKECNIYGNFEL